MGSLLSIHLGGKERSNMNFEICDECEGDGYIQMSCCGDDMKGIWYDNDLCPSCYEHCGEPEHEDCEECDGTGKIALKRKKE